jgi:hypothetical protein
MALSEIVSISISTDVPRVKRAGFGIPMVLTCTSLFADRVKFYSEASELVTAGFATTSPEYKAVSAIFSQEQRPERVALGRLALKPTQKWRITPTAANSTAYSVTIGTSTATYTSDASGTVAEITAGLKTAIDALALSLTTTDNGTSLDVVATTAGAWFALEVGDVDLLQVEQTHADPGIATDMAAILAANSDWYMVINPWNSALMAVALAGWVESNSKFFLCGSMDSTILGSGSSDVASTLKTAARTRTAVIYHPKMGEFADAAWAGGLLPNDPGSETWAFKTLSGISATTFTTTEVTNALGKNATLYRELGGVNVTTFGNCADASTSFIDLVRGKDWLQARMQEDIFAAVTEAKKIPYTDEGVAIVEGAIRGVLREGVNAGFLAADPQPQVFVPKVADVSSADKAARLLPDVRFRATLAGALHKVEITGSISV